FTFDDGPNEWSWELAKTLHEQGVKATFFLNGNNWVNVEKDTLKTSDGEKTYMDVIKHYKDMGHQLASHTYEHRQIIGLKEADLDFQMNKESDIIYKAAGVRPAVMRPPTGSYDKNSLEILKKLGYSAVNWDIDTLDWQTHDFDYETNAYKQVMDADTDDSLGHIALEHEVYEQTVKQLVPWVIKYVKSKGYEFVTVADCIGVEPYQ
ncbi:hypothetical protein BDF20DRAFT_818542, partial [Mycotypha africana]|uniref:uncharacterized protein n=1 Tax=Mycotypha africana TaxID=64632 RepID=UPI0022FFDEE5